MKEKYKQDILVMQQILVMAQHNFTLVCSLIYNNQEYIHNLLIVHVIYHMKIMEVIVEPSQ